MSSSSAKWTAGLGLCAELDAGLCIELGTGLGAERAGEVRDGDIPGVRDAGMLRTGELTERGDGDGNLGDESVLSIRKGEGAALYMAEAEN